MSAPSRPTCDDSLTLPVRSDHFLWSAGSLLAISDRDRRCVPRGFRHGSALAAWCGISCAGDRRTCAPLSRPARARLFPDSQNHRRWTRRGARGRALLEHLSTAEFHRESVLPAARGEQFADCEKRQRGGGRDEDVRLHTGIGQGGAGVIGRENGGAVRADDNATQDAVGIGVDGGVVDSAGDQGEGGEVEREEQDLVAYVDVGVEEPEKDGRLPAGGVNHVSADDGAIGRKVCSSPLAGAVAQ